MNYSNGPGRRGFSPMTFGLGPKKLDSQELLSTDNFETTQSNEDLDDSEPIPLELQVLREKTMQLTVKH